MLPSLVDDNGDILLEKYVEFDIGEDMFSSDKGEFMLIMVLTNAL